VWIPFGTATFVLPIGEQLQIQLRTRGSHCKPKKDEKYDNSLHVSFEIREHYITRYDNKFEGKKKTTSNGSS
jgi:hypothetical protein